MIFIGIGANLDSPRYGPPLAACEASLAALDAHLVRVVARSRWYRSRPVPASDQPWFVNGVVRVETALDAASLLALLHRIEAEFGRRRTLPTQARVLDLDLLAYGGMLAQGKGAGPILPHPRLHERAFVLYPLRDIAPDWRHPGSGATIEDMLRALPPGQDCVKLAEEGPEDVDFGQFHP